MPLELSLPLLSAIVYVAGALFLKRANDLGCDVWRVTCMCNWTAAMVFVPLLLLGGRFEPWHLVWQPALVGLLFLVGQILTFLALRVGDVSIATPVLGLKIILVALFSTALFGDRITTPLWIAAVLSSVAIALLNRTARKAGGRVGATVLASGSAAACYALFDVLTQRWSGTWGSGAFLPTTMACTALFSFAIWPLRDRERTREERARARKPLLLGAVCLGVQSAMFVSTIGIYGRATAANVLYSSRGLWSVLAVWLVGHWFHNQEQHLGARILAWRVVGAALLLAAIVLVILT
jgi:drug/metabolite transporter (DMT)-like permease